MYEGFQESRRLHQASWGKTLAEIAWLDDGGTNTRGQLWVSGAIILPPKFQIPSNDMVETLHVYLHA